MRVLSAFLFRPQDARHDGRGNARSRRPDRRPQIPVRRILDAGCGTGLLRRPFAKLLPRARYTGLERSAYLCERYGWTAGSIADFVPRTPYDLVICYDMLQY